MAKIIAVASGKGGTGKTTTSINLGLALNKLGKDVLVVDANINTPNIGLHLGTPVLDITLNDVLDGDKDILDASYLHHSGIKIVPASISLDNLKISSEKIKNVFNELSTLNSDVILDTGPGFGEEVLAALEASDETLIVTTPDLPSVTDSLKTVKIAEELGSSVIGIVLNKVKKGELEMSIEEIENMLDRSVIGVVPDDDSVRKALKMKNPLVYLYPKSKAAVAFGKLASNLAGESYIDQIKKKKKFFSALKKGE